MVFQNSDEILAEKLTTLLTSAGEACVGLNGDQMVQLLGGLSVQLEATLLASIPHEYRASAIDYMAGARLAAHADPLLTLQAELQAQA